MNARALWFAILVVVATGCATEPRWRVTRRPDVLDAAALLASDSAALARLERPEEVPRVPVRRRLRPCCGFGSSLRVRVGAVPVPGVSIGNLRSADDLGRHTYDAGRNAQEQMIGGERNGLVYTCRGGFIDSAHVRDYADWTLYLATEFGRRLETGGRISLPGLEGGTRTIFLEPVDESLIRSTGRRDIAAALAVWTAFRLSTWHEIATWYGWSSFSVFPERASAFSPEDLYSNLLGAKIAAAIITSGNDLSEPLFNQAADAWLEQSLRFLGAVPASLGEDVMGALDGAWWDSTARLPDAALVQRRNFHTGLILRPWLAPDHTLAAATRSRLAEACDGDLAPHPLRNAKAMPRIAFADYVRLEIELSGALAAHPAFRRFEGRVSDHAFEALIDRVREEAREEFGPWVEDPEAPRQKEARR